MSLMVCMLSLEWSAPPIAYKLRFLHDLPEIAFVKTTHVAQKNHGFLFSMVLTKTAIFVVSSVTITALVRCGPTFLSGSFLSVLVTYEVRCAKI